MKKKKDFKYSFLLVFFMVALVIQIIYLIPHVVMNTASLYAITPTVAITAWLSQALLFLLLLISVAYSLSKYQGK